MANYKNLYFLLAIVVKVHSNQTADFPISDVLMETNLTLGKNSTYKLVSCSGAIMNEREEVIRVVQCWPKNTFVLLRPVAPELGIFPGAVWVKRCEGPCEYIHRGACVPTNVTIKQVPVRISNVRTRLSHCAQYPVEEHHSCACCDDDGGNECVPVEPAEFPIPEDPNI